MPAIRPVSMSISVYEHWPPAKNVKQQITELFNENFTALLNQTLQEQVILNKTLYEFRHPYKGVLQLNTTNELYYYNITQ